MKIETMTPFHADVAAEIDQACFGIEVFSADKIRTFLEAPTIFGFISHVNDEPVGYALFQNVMDEGEILTVGILPQFQGKGYGKKLLKVGLKELWSRQVTDAFLEVRKSNKVAITMYENFGAKKVGERKGYYENANGTREDALVLRFSLDQFDCFVK